MANFKDFRNRYPDIVRNMNEKIIEYQDRWKKFLKQTLRSISFLSHDLSDIIIEDFYYELETDKIEAGNFLFRKGFPCDCIYIIVNGELDILMDNNGNGRETYIETLGQSSIIGTYATLKEEKYSYSCKARSDCNLMYLKFETLELLRGRYEELDYYLLEYESFLEETGSPFCDFIKHRQRDSTFNLIDVFISGVKRARNILDSYSSKLELDGILKKVQETIRKERAEEKMLKKKQFEEQHRKLDQEEINTQLIENLKKEITSVVECVVNQKNTIDLLLRIIPLNNISKEEESMIKESMDNFHKVQQNMHTNAVRESREGGLLNMTKSLISLKSK